MLEVYTSHDIWLCAYFLAETDAKLDSVNISRNGRMQVSFSFSGENLRKLAASYNRQQAVANVAQLREKLNFLRDIIFQSKKKETGR